MAGRIPWRTSGDRDTMKPIVTISQLGSETVALPPLCAGLARSLHAFYLEGMSEHKMTLTWKRGDLPFDYQKYSRNHTWKFDGGHEMTASAAPVYLGDPKQVDPEEAFVASLSACHMLTFLAIVCKQKFVLDEYVDDAVGHMEKNAEGRMAITKVTLRPKLKWSGDKQPGAEELDKMHHMAHEQCFIANSVKTAVTVEK